MSINHSETIDINGSSSSGQTAGNVGFLPIGQLRTSYSCLRPGAIHHLPNDTAELPIRVVPADDGTYEVLDGFKRLKTWREQGQECIPVVLERPGRTEEHKRLLLEANSPKRTLTALDEARVAHSLMNEEGLTPNRIVRLLERKPQWVARRMDIAKHLSATAEDKLARGAIGPTLAHALCALSGKEQDAVLSSIDKNSLKAREALALVATYRVADEIDRHELLKAPLGWVRAEPTPTPTTSPDATELEKRLEHIREALVSLANFVIPPELAPAEQRRLDARLQSVLDQLQQTACALGIEHEGPNLTGDQHDRQETRTTEPTTFNQTPPRKSHDLGGDPGRDRQAPPTLRKPGDCSTSGLFPQDRSTRSAREGVLPKTQTAPPDEQARTLPRDDQGQDRQGVDHHPNPARDPRGGLLRRAEHSCRVCSNATGQGCSGSGQDCQATLRNSSR